MLDKGIFLSSELVWLEGSLVGPDHPAYRPPYILDLTDGQRYELLTLKLPPRLKDGNFNPDNSSYIQFADRVFVDLSGHRLIALSANFRANQNERVILDGFSGDDDEFLDLVKSFGVEYENVDSSESGPDSNVSSPSGKLFVKNGGIYLSNTNALFEAIPYSYYFRSWYYDDSGVVIHDDYGTYWIMTQFFGDYYHLSRPVLKLRLAVP